MSKHMDTRLQFSAGGVVYRKTGSGTEVVILTRGNGKIFCLPKGKIEKHETPQQAAFREIKEETGLTGTIEKELGKINYWFYSDEDGARVPLRRDRTRINKTVYFYLVRYESGSTADHDADAEDVRWLPVEEALKIASYPSERQMIENARKEIW